MRKILLIMMLLGNISFLFAQDLIFNSRLEIKKDVEIKDTIKRKIKYTDKKIVFENYFINSSFYMDDKDLTLHIDSVVSKNMAFEKFDRDWFYCTSDLGFKYIVIGLESANIHLYQICSEVEVFEEMFSSLKED